MEATPINATRTELERATSFLVREIEEGLKHGFFDMAVSCELINGRKRRLTIKAGKNHRFTIPEQEIC